MPFECLPTCSSADSIGITPLSGTTDERHMKEDVAVETSKQLAPPEVEALEAALRMVGATMK